MDPNAEPHDPPFVGDPSWRVSRTLEDGTTITIRPISPDDREALRQGFHETSPETRYSRFLASVGEPSEEMLTYLTSVDQKDHVALVATTTSPDLKTERGIGVARFIRLHGEPDCAEAAITVVDDMQKRGVGTALARELERTARLRGIRRIRANVLADNAMMRSILEMAGARVVGSEEAGTLTYDVELEPPSIAERVRAILRGAAVTMAMEIRRHVPPPLGLSGAAAAASDGERRAEDPGERNGGSRGRTR